MYNERRGAEVCVREVCAHLTRMPHRTRLIVVDDGSTDGTGEILTGLEAAEPKLFRVAHEKNRGYGAALQTGARCAHEHGFDYVLFMDSDLTNHPSDIPQFAARMEQGFDVIKATRYRLGGHVRSVPLYRVLISKVGNQLARLLFRLPVTDCTNGFRAVKVKLLVRMSLEERRFPVIMEELYWCRFMACTYAQIPVTLTNRDATLRPTSFAYKPSVFYAYLKYPARAWLGIKPRGLTDQENE
jgi:glycosyltransferase involved in cell wall biosynthesis